MEISWICSGPCQARHEPGPSPGDACSKASWTSGQTRHCSPNAPSLSRPSLTHPVSSAHYPSHRTVCCEMWLTSKLASPGTKICTPKTKCTTNRQKEGKGYLPPKGKTSFLLPPQKWKRGEAASSHAEGLQAVTGLVASCPRPWGEHEYGLKILPPSIKAWYKICRLKRMHPDLVVDEHWLRSKYPAILKSIHELGLIC